ncbi:malate dehydrogenase-like [Choristoneura fumiferana]|uniref:malate dehydrogenase-like n=1 Tax=Choristoneura fumiferana TaxID=7141 RepID=UPI003D158E29
MFRLAGPVKHLVGLGKYFARLQRFCSKTSKVPTDKTSRKKFQVSIIGGTSQTAQSLSLLLKEHLLINRLMLYDLPKSTCGLGIDLSHIPSQTLVEGKGGYIGSALRDSDIVVLACSEPRKTGQTDYDLYRANANRIVQSVKEICKHCPKAFIVNLTEPINYTVPLTSLVLHSSRCYDSSKVLGVTGTDGMKAQACLNLLYKIPPEQPVNVPVICGHSAKTAVPLLSHITPWFNVDACASIMITEIIRESEGRIVALKRGSGQSCCLTAYAGFKTVSAILSALDGVPKKDIGFVANNDYDTKFFAAPVNITKDGISDVAEYKFVGSIEAAYLKDAVKELRNEINEAETYYNEAINDKKPTQMY